MNKILVIGQAPPAVKQEYPYDTTLLYEMLLWAGIGKIEAQELFEFDALTNEFPGHDKKGGHKKPSRQAIDRYFAETLCEKLMKREKIIALGALAIFEYTRQSSFFVTWPCYYDKDIPVLCLPHPSKRNYALIHKNKEKITELLILSTTKPTEV